MGVQKKQERRFLLCSRYTIQRRSTRLMLSWIDSRVAKDDSYWSRWKRGTRKLIKLQVQQRSVQDMAMARHMERMRSKKKLQK
jgi:hypothetical protein